MFFSVILCFEKEYDKLYARCLVLACKAWNNNSRDEITMRCSIQGRVIHAFFLSGSARATENVPGSIYPLQHLRFAVGKDILTHTYLYPTNRQTWRETGPNRQYADSHAPTTRTVLRKTSTLNYIPSPKKHQCSVRRNHAICAKRTKRLTRPDPVVQVQPLACTGRPLGDGTATSSHVPDAAEL